MTYEEIMATLKAGANPENAAGMARFGISPDNLLGISVMELRKLARHVGKDHFLALRLWRSGVHEARILAGLIDVPDLVDEGQMGEWAKEIDSWDICDLTCNNLFRKTIFAHAKALLWASGSEEFVKRAGFVLMATLAVHDKTAGDAVFLEYLSVVEREAGDERNFVRKAVNWALRQIGKRNKSLNRFAIEAAKSIHMQGSRSARRIARDALRELESPKVMKRLKS